MLKLPELDFSEITPIYLFENIPRNSSGIYLLYDDNLELMYVGKAKYIKDRVSQHYFARGVNEDKINKHYSYYSYALVEDPVDRDIYETWYINILKPKLNRDKVYTYKSSYKKMSKEKNIVKDEAWELKKQLAEILEKTSIILD